MINRRMVLFLAGVIFLLPTSSHAYIDPGTGGMLLQLLLGGVAGVLIVLKVYWRRFKTFITGENQPGKESPGAANRDEQ